MINIVIRVSLAMVFLAMPASAHEIHVHETHADATYLANEAVLVSQGDTKVLFDPFFPSGFGTYQEVPAPMKAAIMAGEAPFDGVDAVFVSHVHPDHFSATDMLAYMEAHKDVHLFVPVRGLAMMKEEISADSQMFKRVNAIALENGDQPQKIRVGNVTAEIVRVPHSGWPENMSDVSNLIYRVTLDNGVTVMHMGDADVNDSHYAPHDKHWKARTTDHAFPPYWFFGNEEGKKILNTRINAKTSTSIHVPIKVPTGLTNGSHDYFSKIGESRVIRPTKD